MLDFLYGLTTDTMYLISIGGFFLCFALLWFATASTLQRSLESYRDNFTSTASANMSDMFLFVDPARLFMFNLGALLVMPIVVFIVFRDFVSSVVIFFMILVLPSMFYRSMRKARLKRIEVQLPDALMMVSGSLRAGASLNIALEAMVKEAPAPISQEFELYLKEQRLGVDFEVSMDNMEERIPLQDFGMLATALRINREVGGNLADTIESLGETLRRKGTMEGKIKSLTAQGKMQGVVMSILPILLGVILTYIEPEAMSQLWSTPLGWAWLGVIVVMEIIGFFIISKIVAIDV